MKENERTENSSLPDHTTRLDANLHNAIQLTQSPAIPHTGASRDITTIGKGESFPLGAHVCPGGVNFSIFSNKAAFIDLLLFDSPEAVAPERIIHLNPKKHRTNQYWHVFVPGITAGQIYGYRAYGQFKPHRGHRFDPGKLLLDPYGKAVAVPAGYSRLRASLPGNNISSAMKSVVADLSAYDWEGDAPIKRSFAETIIYELHVKGFTMHPSSGIALEKRGTFAGLIEKIPYLQQLGITAIELMPVFQFDEQDCPQGLKNYWGYCPVSFFAPHHTYSTKKNPLAALDEFRDMVKAMHKAGIEVILDVVFNHTAEGNEHGPTICFKGLGNKTYYILEKDRSRYADYTRTGNTLNTNNAIVKRLIIDSLHYWVQEMHVDGFRFDLASIMSRDVYGRPVDEPPILFDIDSDPVLAGIKLIAEAWDADGLYQVGGFIGDNWKEWNNRFRDDVRSFMKGDDNTVSHFASRIIGSPDIYGHEEREPEQSINFITCHDGFTLNDLVSYNFKHNQPNGENNLDGLDYNISWNCGIEGPSFDRNIEALRTRQIKNFLAITLFSLGTPMLYMGDEVRRTQKGNNNAYCQDNETNWLDWALMEKNKDILRFTRLLILGRLHRDAEYRDYGLSLNKMLKKARIEWHGIKLHKPDWGSDSHSIAMTAWSLSAKFVIHLMVNAYWRELSFELPPVADDERRVWLRWLDTALPSPDDIRPLPEAAVITTPDYIVQPRSVVLLIAGEEKT